MRNKILEILNTLLLFILLFLEIYTLKIVIHVRSGDVDHQVVGSSIESINENTTLCEEYTDYAIHELKTNEMFEKMETINLIEDKEKWFISYKELIEEYFEYIDPPLTIYDCYTEDEIRLIYKAVETECFDQDFMSKVNVASVILNRVERGNFGEDIEEVITKENQFAYGRDIITESSINAVEYAFQIEDTTNGCIAFRSDISPEKWHNWEYVFTDNSGHHFYREVE